MGKHRASRLLVQAMESILAATNPMTVRQVFYQLVAGRILENTEGSYKRVSRLLSDARRQGVIPWAWVEDRLRRPRTVPMWDGVADFASVAAQYRRDVWVFQEHYVETWLEKDALAGFFEDVLAYYGVTLNVGRGYDGWDSIHNAALRIREMARPTTILYFGDFDPSGEDMVRSLRTRLDESGVQPEMVKCALTAEDIQRYGLPPAPAKQTDTRTRKFVEQHGDVSVELDALPVEVLVARLRAEVERCLDLPALAALKAIEQQERQRIAEALDALEGA